MGDQVSVLISYHPLPSTHPIDALKTGVRRILLGEMGAESWERGAVSKCLVGCSFVWMRAQQVHGF